MAGGGSYKLFSQLNPPSTAGGPVNSLLFIKDATLLISGGDDQILRLWDPEHEKCLQELRDPRWGQITALSWNPEQREQQQAALFLGTGRGIVCAYPFSTERTRFLLQASSTTRAFTLDDSVEVQALDASNSRFVVGSHSGKIRMFSIHHTTALDPLWTFELQDIPRSILFNGDHSERLMIHTCCLGEMICSDSDTGHVVGVTRLHGGVGSAALSPDGSMKAVYNLSTGDFDVYQPPDSLTPVTLPLPSGTRLIKQCVFAEEDGRTLVCGGDNGTINLFQLGEVPHQKSLVAEAMPGPDAFYAVTAMSTRDYHFIAGGESEEPATIFVWRKPTRKRAAEDRKFRKLQADKESVVNQAAENEKETKALKEKLASMEKMFQLRAESSRSSFWQSLWGVSLLLLASSLIVFLAYRNSKVNVVLVGTQEEMPINGAVAGETGKSDQAL